MKAIYNYQEALKKHLVDTKQELSEIEIYAEVVPQGNAQIFILLVDIGGKIKDSPALIQYEPELAVICQHTDNAECKELAFKVFDAFKQISDVAITFKIPKSESEATLNFASIRAEETPTPLGNIGNGMFQYFCNYQILVGGEYEENP
jgi:hypothetical protein